MMHDNGCDNGAGTESFELNFICNREQMTIATRPAITLLDLLRKALGISGVKEGCREGECGACTVLAGTFQDGAFAYRAVPACLMPASAADGCHIVTIEGLDSGRLNPLQQAFVDSGASQCGFCTPGFIVALTGYLCAGTRLNLEDAIASLDGNICRCTGYAAIRRAVALLFERHDLGGKILTTADLIAEGLLPGYFAELQEPSRGAAARTPASGARIMAGGTDLYVQLGDDLANHCLCTVEALNGADRIEEHDDRLVFPAATTITDFGANATLNSWYPGLREACALFGSTLIRNRATLGGNVVNASPIGDASIILLSLQATVAIQARSGGPVRAIKLADFFLGYKQLDLQAAEWVRSFTIPKPADDCHWGFRKVAKREHFDIASVNAAINLCVRNDRITSATFAIGGVAPVPLLATATGKSLCGERINATTLHAAVSTLKGEIHPIDDSRGAALYKQELAGRLLTALLLELFPDRLHSANIKGDLL